MKEMIKLENIDKYFLTTHNKKNQVLHSLNLSVEPGEVFGFLGPNGAGKSTTIKILLNFIQSDSGSLFINGQKVGSDEHRYKLGYLAEFPCFYPNLTAIETLKYVGTLSGLKSKSLLQDQISELLSLVDLSHVATQRISSYSKGMKQRLGLAVALIDDPDVLILDEPMSGLDPIGRYLVKRIIAQLKGAGKTIFFSSHILTDIEELCDQIGIIHKGHLLYKGTLSGFQKNEDISFEEMFVAKVEEWDQDNA